eukprot:TRINITY_DN1201_c0_g2_i2.p1 TRINITY_DN1201_c0_g2~~TRINITY_DN1201_c0_g2_i2.p1  ORF type:complete len:487 (-),score=84.73 TRINITY_DN1201_c0_g2_i2:216-1676(-)
MSSALNRTVRSRRNREFKEEYEKVFYVLLEEFGLSYGNVVDKHSKTLTKLRDLLNSEVTKLDEYVAVFKDSVRPLLSVNSYYLEMIIKHTQFCRRIVSNAQEVQMHVVAFDVMTFAKEYDQQRNRLPDYQVEIIMGWWFALYIHVLAIVQATSTSKEEAKFSQIAADYLAQSSAVAILLVAGLHLYDKSLLRNLGLTEREREREERDTRYNSVPSTPDDSSIREKSRKLTQATRKRLRSAHKYLKLQTEKRGTVLPENSGMDDPDALRQTLSVAYKRACWTSVVKLQRAYPPLSTVITCLVKCIPAHTCRQLLGIDKTMDARFADRTVIATDPTKLHTSSTTIEDLSLADAETSNDSKLIILLSKVFRIERFVEWLREKWPTGNDDSHIVGESKTYVARQILVLSWSIQMLADYKEGIPFQNPEAADCWLEFRDLLQQFMTYFVAAARRGFGQEAVQEQLGLLLVQIRFFITKTVELQSFESCLID